MACCDVRKLLISINKRNLSFLLSLSSHVFVIIIAECWVWQRWDVSHSVMELVSHSHHRTTEPGMAGLVWGHTWWQHHSIITTGTGYYGGHQTPHHHPHLSWGPQSVISHCSPRVTWYRTVSIDMCEGREGGGRREERVGGGVEWHARKHQFFLAQLQSAAKQPAGLSGWKYRAKLGLEKMISMIYLLSPPPVSQCQCRAEEILSNQQNCDPTTDCHCWGVLGRSDLAGAGFSWQKICWSDIGRLRSFIDCQSDGRI